MEPCGDIQPCEGARILARVGSDAILESEVAGAINEVIEKNKDRIPASELEKQRELMIQQQLKNVIVTKLIYQDAKHTIPSESLSHVEKELKKQFDEVELEKMMKRAQVSTSHEFDQKLRALGTSVDHERQAFVERELAKEWIHQQIKRDEEITYDQMVTYYREHQDKFGSPARAKWEELMVRYSKYPNKATAYDAIARLGNQILAGAPFAEVAKVNSDGSTAFDGGKRDWTTKGGLACQTLDAAVFSTPVGQMSSIIEGDSGFHIIRVTLREEESVKPFLEAQVEIKEKIIQQRSEKQYQAYLAKLGNKTPVWTIYEGDISNPQLSNRPPQSVQR
jgi:parvulin-like peptidyl-prolyl isomerase